MIIDNMKQSSKYSPKRLAWLSLGLLCVALGAIGVILPLMPTTVFLLVATFAFARSSPKLHNWLLEHRIFGNVIKNWQTHKAIGKKAKRASAVSMIAIVALSWGMGAPSWVVGSQVVILGLVATFIMTRPLPPH